MELRYILHILQRRKNLAGGVFAAIFFTILATTLLVPPRYDATARVLIRKSFANIAVLKNIGMSDQAMASAALSDTDRADYLALVSLRDVAEKTIAELGLQRLRARARLIQAVPGLSSFLQFFGVNTHLTTKPMTAEQLLDSPLSAAIFPQPNAKISQYEDTDIIEIKGSSPRAEEARDIANAMGRNFIIAEQERIRREYAGARKFIDLSIDRAKDEYLTALNAMQALQEKEQFSDLDTEISTLIDKLAEYKKAVEDNRVNLLTKNASIADMEQRLKSVPMFQKSSEKLKDNENLGSLRQSLQNLYLALAETKAKYTKEHPLVIETEAKITETQRLMAKELQKVFGEETVSVNSLYDDLTQNIAQAYAEQAGFESQAKVLPEVVARYEAAMARLPKKVAENAKLQLTLSATQEVYAVLLQSRLQVGMAEVNALADIHLIETAIAADQNASRHRKPSLLVNTFLAIILGSVFAVGSALFIHYLDDKIHDISDLKDLQGLIILGGIPRLTKEVPTINTTMRLGPLMDESMRAIRLALSARQASSPWRSLTVTSALPMEGKSLVAAQLARSYAEAGRSILLIDANFRHPSLHLDSAANATVSGLADYLAGKVEMPALAQPTTSANLKVIFAGVAPTAGTDLLESPKLQELIRTLSDQFDMVIIDTPPLLTNSDAFIIAKLTDGTLLTIMTDRVQKAQLKAVLDACRTRDIGVIGAIVNHLPGPTSTIPIYSSHS